MAAAGIRFLRSRPRYIGAGLDVLMWSRLALVALARGPRLKS
ncbi:predicted protein [Plenodomus lingam JN3]|uniref:Predicted protein n=1 Tax=Leptosphaeria maculans (strain JN3 / isolate v23.1.3 / race Av1-4-5-6-7-8) TaxID=985895 RepID=E5AAW4_LEPMJ|nr:predicted protein [Plenodomus lingam JN3]CBY00805.1 predicted protein [Plenodomus lingam JN3]